MNTSPFAKLAPELRNGIYGLVVCLDKPIIVLVEDNNPPHVQYPALVKDAIVPAEDNNPPDDGSPALVKDAIALTAACRQIHSETLPIFYGANRFELQTRAFKLSDTNKPTNKFQHANAGEEIARVRSQRATTFRVGRQPPSLWQWLHQIGQQNARLLRNVDIVLGTWDYSHPLHAQPAFALPSTLTPLARLFGNMEVVCSVVVDIFKADIEE